MDDFSYQLLRLRKARKLSQAALAEAVGVSRNTIGQYERGETRPSTEIAFRLARAFGVGVGEVLEGGDDRADNPGAGDPFGPERREAVSKLDDHTRDVLLHVVDTFLRDARAREAYAA